MATLIQSIDELDDSTKEQIQSLIIDGVKNQLAMVDIRDFFLTSGVAVEIVNEIRSKLELCNPYFRAYTVSGSWWDYTQGLIYATKVKLFYDDRVKKIFRINALRTDKIYQIPNKIYRCVNGELVEPSKIYKVVNGNLKLFWEK